eukprot:7907765-Lingulodinium_polyedra.AAC.1
MRSACTRGPRRAICGSPCNGPSPPPPLLVDTRNIVMGPEWKGMSLGKSPRCADLIPAGTPGSPSAPLLEAAG